MNKWIAYNRNLLMITICDLKAKLSEADPNAIKLVGWPKSVVTSSECEKLSFLDQMPELEFLRRLANTICDGLPCRLCLPARSNESQQHRPEIHSLAVPPLPILSLFRGTW